ncbi:hypothetical protein QAD02_010538 [Eretmocerus hayati]|uniref:Uncharacterized protein n=1 Tax=Eretmocerus hayati TaxID=131215 RepID=A0ACC2NUE3_9HYME|nr:hypothetical protein QAD02_010538 [Eretmocerus hayati]
MKFSLTVCFALTLAFASQALPLAPGNESRVGESYDQSGSYADATTASSPEDDTTEEPNSNEVTRERRFILLKLIAEALKRRTEESSRGSSREHSIEESYEGEEASLDAYSARRYQI